MDVPALSSLVSLAGKTALVTGGAMGIGLQFVQVGNPERDRTKGLGLGLPMAIVLFTALGVLVARCLRGALLRKRDRLAPSVANSSS